MDYGLGESAPDGHTYVHFMEAPPALLTTYRLLLQAESTARSIGGAEGRARAQAIALLLVKIEGEVTAAGQAAAVAAETAIRDKIDSTRVRPQGSDKLKDAIAARLVPSAPAGGAVGIADIDRLNTIAVDQQGQAYWRAQELGSSHLVGRRIKGVFQPGAAAPSQAEFRVHPIFEQGVAGGSMLVRRPIEPRHFIAEGVNVADSVRLGAFRRIDKDAVTQMRAIIAGSHSFVDRARRVARGRRR